MIGNQGRWKCLTGDGVLHCRLPITDTLPLRAAPKVHAKERVSTASRRRRSACASEPTHQELTMTSVFLRATSATAMSLAVTLMPALTLSADLSQARAGIQSTVDKANALFHRSASAEEIAAALFEDDLMVTGEGEKGSYRNLKSFMGSLAAHTAAGPRCTLAIVDPIRSSGDLAVAFLAEHCTAAKAGEPEEDTRVMFAFRNGAHGWRVTMASFSIGKY
ncbi:MAG: nuclear transport factor 2 family protein [Steroidobacter sp.]|nr:nuclear transport factor 2 family protein [Steroidobacter sp.]